MAFLFVCLFVCLFLSVQLQQQMDEKFKKQFPNRREIEVVSSTAKWKQRDTAARTLQRALRNYLR